MEEEDGRTIYRCFNDTKAKERYDTLMPDERRREG